MARLSTLVRMDRLYCIPFVDTIWNKAVFETFCSTFKKWILSRIPKMVFIVNRIRE